MAFVLTIRERAHSWAGRKPVTSLHKTRSEAVAALVSYVRRNWDAEMDEDQPQDDDELVERYFDDVLEAYEIGEATERTTPDDRLSKA